MNKNLQDLNISHGSLCRYKHTVRLKVEHLKMKIIQLKNTHTKNKNKTKRPFHPLVPTFASNNKRTLDRSLRNPCVE